MVGDGDGGMSPPDSLLDHLFRVRQGIHIAHLRVEVQLHTLLRGGILPLSVLRQLDVVGVQLDVLQYRRVALREREVLLHDACGPFRPRDFVRRKAAECDESAVVHDLLELPDGFKKLRHRFRVLYLFRDNPALAQRAEGALLTAAHLRRLGKEQIAEMENGNTESEDSDAKNDSEEASPFRDFSGQDYDGNTVDESLFSKNAVTVVNFWFTGCKPCVAELSKLNELNDAIKSMGGEVVGINTETFDGNQDAIKEAAAVLESQGAKYRNLSIDSASAAGKYASDIMAFPTTILVDRNGNIVGEPMLGGIDNQENYDTLMKQIQSVIDADSAK